MSPDHAVATWKAAPKEPRAHAEKIERRAINRRTALHDGQGWTTDGVKYSRFSFTDGATETWRFDGAEAELIVHVQPLGKVRYFESRVQ